MESLNEISCLPNGKWSDHLPNCLEKYCSLDPNEYSKKFYSIFSTSPSNPTSQHDNYNYSINSIIRVICQPGYVLYGPATNQLSCVLEPIKKIAKWNLDNLPVCKQELFCPFKYPPENGLINSSGQATSSGYALNTTIEFKCVKGYKLRGPRIILCKERSNVEQADWSEVENVTCEIDPEVLKAVTKIEYLEESCKIDFSSMLISYSSLDQAPTQTQNFNDDFVFINATIGEFIRHEQTVLYFCKTKSQISYTAKCLNGTLLMQQNCNELKKCKLIFNTCF